MLWNTDIPAGGGPGPCYGTLTYLLEVIYLLDVVKDQSGYGTDIPAGGDQGPCYETLTYLLEVIYLLKVIKNHAKIYVLT